jgi:hypothetical protein
MFTLITTLVNGNFNNGVVIRAQEFKKITLNFCVYLGGSQREFSKLTSTRNIKI